MIYQIYFDAENAENADVSERNAIGMAPPLHYAASTRANRASGKLLNHPNIDVSLADDGF